ncbi:unnamed protein product [Closterium sp. NIES-54]
MAGPEERGGRGAGGSGEAQTQGQPRDSAMAPVQPSLGPPRGEPRVFGLDKFNGDNFAKWSFKMENIFDHYYLLEVMEGTEKCPENDPEKSPWVRKSAQGYLLLGQALKSSQIRHIKPFQREPEKGPKAWAALKGVHAPATAAVAVVLERQMAALRIEEDEAVEEGELQKKTKLLALLPQSWSSLIINLNRDLPRLSLEDVKRAILQEDFRRRELASADGAEAASIGRGYGRGRGRGRGGSRFGCNNFSGGRGSGAYCSDNKSSGRGRGRFDGESHYCHKSGHMWRDCYKLPDGWTPAQGQEGRGAGGGRGRGRGGRGGRGGGAASMKSAGNKSKSRDDRFPGQFFFVSTQVSAGPEKDEGFEEPAAVGKVTLHSLDYWVIDSGATYSMTPRADLLTELEPSPVKHVTSALGQQAEVKGMGKAMFKGADGKMVGLKNVLWVPNLAANLISVRRLQKAGMDTSSKGAKTYTARLGERILWDLHEDKDVYNEMWRIPVVPMPKERQVAASISTKGEAVGSGDGANGRAKEIKSKKCNLGGTSKLGEHEESGAAFQKQHKGEENRKAAEEEEYGENMWGTIASAAFSNPTSATGECDWLTLHRRMGHVALPILQQLVKNEMVAGIRVKGEPDEVLGCPTCMQAKFTRYPFSSSEATAKAPLDEVVMDVVGPLKLGAAETEYFLTIVDVYTRMTWVYVLSKKSDLAETVKTDWLPMVEQQQDRLVKAIRTDRGGEFLSKEFSLWLKKNGIRHSLTMPYSSAINGIAERANRTITETAHGLLIEAGLPDNFWFDAVRSACMAKNRALNHVGADKWVPYVEWIGRKPKVDMLWVFRCMCMALVPKHLWHNKLGAKAIWVVHLGMAQNSKGWLLWDPFTKKFLVSRDCKFMENLMYKDWKAENGAKIGVRFGDVKGSGLEHVEQPLELRSSSTNTRQSSLVNGGEEAKDAEEEEEEVQQVSERAPTLPSRTMSAPRIRVTPQQRQGLHVPAAEEEGRGKRRIQAPNRLTYDALGRPAKSALAGAALIVGDDEESDYDECAFVFFSPVEMPGEPATLKEALESSEAEEWKKAMESELKSIELVAKGYQQKKKVDYKELFAPVVKPTTLRTLLAGAAIKGWVVKQMDVTTAFLNGVLEEEIFMAQPEGFDDGSGREMGFTPSTADHSLFMLGEGEQRSFMVVYVDDILIFSPSSDLVKEVMLKLQDKFKCKALGDVSFYLGLHIERDVEKRCMRVHQRKYLEALAANFGQSEGHVATPFPSGFKCVKGPEEESVGEERAAPHSSEFFPTEAPLQTLHMDVWGPARVRGQGHERYFLLVVDDYSRYTTVFPLHSKGEVTEVLIDWIRAARLQLRECFSSDFPVLRLHSDRGGEFSSDLLRAFYRAEGIRQTFTLPASPQKNGIAERRIGMVMDVARTSMIYAAAPRFLWPFLVQYAAHQINLQPRVSLPETSPTLRWTGKVGAASAFRVWGSRAFVRDFSAEKLSFRAVPCVFLGFPPDAPGWQFYHPTSRRVLSSQDVTFDESVPYYRLFPYHTAPLPPPPLFLAPGPPPVDPLPPQGPAPSGVSQVDAVEPVEVAANSGASGGAEPGGAESGGAEPGGAESGGAEPGGAEPGGTGSGGAESEREEPGGAASGGAEPGATGSGASVSTGAARVVCSPWSRAAGAGGAAATGGFATAGGTGAGGATGAGTGVSTSARGTGATGPGGARTGGTGAAGPAGAPRAGAGGAAGVSATGGTGAGAGVSAGGAGAGGTAGVGVLGLPPSSGPAPSLECPPPVQSESQLQLASPLPAPSPYSGPTGGLAERREPESRPASPVRTARTSRRFPRSRPPAVPGTHQMALRPSTVPQRFPLPSPPASSLPALADPASDSLRAASPTVTRLLTTVVTDPSFESTAASALVTELVDFAAHCCLDFATSLVAESPSFCPPFVGGESALSTDVLEDRQEEFQCFAAALPHLLSTLLAPEGDPDAPDIPTPRSYAEAIEGPYSSQWQAAMDAEMASWKSTGTYVDEVPPPGANIVSGMWIFRVKRPQGSPPVFKARYVA